MSGVGIYAGTFDPVHNGHLVFALATAKVCGLKKVIFLPERQPRGKPHAAAISHRVAMVKLAIRGHRTLAVHELDDAVFSVKKTLPDLQKLFKGQRLTLLVGSDNALDMNPVTWPDIERVYKTTDLAVGMRAGHDREDLSGLASKAKVTFIYTNFPHAAATKVRSGAYDLVKPAVRDYMVANHLYGN